MKKSKLALIFGLVVLVIAACKKPEEEFEYPEEDITEPELIVHMTRNIAEKEEWMASSSVENCYGNLSDDNYAFQELNYSRGFATLHLIPDSATCELSASYSSAFFPNEISTVNYDELKLEFTFSELRIDSMASVWLECKYNQLDIRLNLAPVLLVEQSKLDSNHALDGVFTIDFTDPNIAIDLNGENWQPALGSSSGNHIITNYDGAEGEISVDLSCQDTKGQSYMVFQFIRISSFGIP